MRLKELEGRSLLLGVVLGAGAFGLVGAAQSDTPASAPPRYQLSENWTDVNGGHGVYRLDVVTGEVTEIVGNRAFTVLKQ